MNSVVLVTIVLVLTAVKLNSATVNLETKNSRSAFDQHFYENALDPELCAQQIEIIKKNILLWLKFIESGMRIPRGITEGNTADLGNYYQCIGISDNVDDAQIEGKYCSINVPVNQNLTLPELSSLPDWAGIDLPDWINVPDGIDLPDWITNPRKLQLRTPLSEIMLRNRDINVLNVPGSTQIPVERSGVPGLQSLNFRLAVCVPKVCTIKEGLDGLLFNITNLIAFQYEERFCRLKNDKPWVPADYVALCLFSILGILTVISTSYDVWQTIILKTDPKKISDIYSSFSVYTNCRRLTTFNKSPGMLDCLDGIRAIAMIWIIIGHTFVTLPEFINKLDAAKWMMSSRSFWITTAPITVDTFFMLSGLLLVYTTARKLTGRKLLKSLHLFYLNRLLRMFPLLAAAVLVQASLLHRIFDGPQWENVAANTEFCRRNWWITLLYLQNIINPETMCLSVSWYLAIDMQLHIISPIVLFFVLGRKKNVAWSALIGSLLAVLAGAAAYIFSKKFRGSSVHAGEDDGGKYFSGYYINTLARASPFFVGMVFGYVLHLYRENKVYMSKFTAILLWVCALCITSLVIYSSEPMKDLNWDNQIADSFVNWLSRPAWALGLGWIIVACVHGYGGPINWFLCLEMWKLPARISYAMYLIHMSLLLTFSGTEIGTIYFSPASCVYRFCAQFAIAFVIGFLATLIIDLPFSTLFKLLLGGSGPKQPRKENKEIISNNEDHQKQDKSKIESYKF